MKIQIVNCVYYPEPIVSAQIGENLANALSNDGHEVQVIAPYPSRPKGFKFDNNFADKKNITIEKTSKNLTLIRLPSFIFPNSNPIGRLIESISFGYSTYKYLIKNDFQADKIYMNTWPLFGQFGVFLACRKRNIPYILHIQDVYPESLVKKLPSFFQKVIFFALFQIERYVVQGATKIVVISEQMKNHICSSRNVSSEKIEVILNWQNDDEFEKYQNSKLANPIPVFMYLGNMGPIAGLPTVIKAFIASNISAKLILAGNGTKKEECIKLSNSHPNIHFWDVPDGQVALTQSKSDILILPMIKGSASSSIPSKLIAYMNSARPIIVLADKDSDTRNSVINADCGWAGDPEEEMWLKETFIKITKIPKNELIQKGINGLRFCKNNFSKEINLQKLVNTIIGD